MEDGNLPGAEHGKEGQQSHGQLAGPVGERRNRTDDAAGYLISQTKGAAALSLGTGINYEKHSHLTIRIRADLGATNSQRRHAQPAIASRVGEWAVRGVGCFEFQRKLSSPSLAIAATVGSMPLS